MKNTFIKNALLIAAILTASGCASGYKQFYKPVPGATPEAIAARRAAPPLAIPTVERSSPRNDPALIDSYIRRGYAAIGYANFTSGRSESESAAIRQAKEVGADLVLIFDPKFVGSTTTNIPVTTPTSSTAYTTSTATAYGSGGPVTAQGNATTTTYGTTTNFIPITVNHSNFGAVFFVKQNYSVGLAVRDLNDEERRTLQTNKGVVVRAVVDNSPAFDADFLVGDILTAVDDHVIGTSASFHGLFSDKKGKSVIVKFFRGTRAMEKTVILKA